MNICENGITRPMNPEEITAMRAQDIRERTRPLNAHDGHLYRCTRDTIKPVYNPLAELVGLYVERVG